VHAAAAAARQWAGARIVNGHGQARLPQAAYWNTQTNDCDEIPLTIPIVASNAHRIGKFHYFDQHLCILETV